MPTFQPVQQQGDVKVTLLQVSRITSFSRQFVQANPGKAIRAIPGVEVIVLTCVSKLALTNFRHSHLKVF